jgi:hypothetical protein
LGEEITVEAEREGVSAAEHATLLLHVATALLRDDPTLFQQAVRHFLAHRAVDASRVSAALDELVRLCLEPADQDRTAFQERLNGVSSGEEVSAEAAPIPLKAWRNALVHMSTDLSLEAIVSPSGPVDPTLQASGRTGGRAFGKYAGMIPTTENYMREKAAEIAREDTLKG